VVSFFLKKLIVKVFRQFFFSEALINWKTVERKMPWELVFLLGGGFALV
jgi:di/tricarboxylate transporter